MREYRYINYDITRNDQEMTFKEWLNFYSDLQNKEAVNLEEIKKIIP